LADPSINTVVAICSAQSAKTLTILSWLHWVITNDPGPFLWVTKNLTEAKRLSKTRFYPSLERCAPTAELLPEGRSDKKTLELYLPGMFVSLTGAEATGALQSTPYRWIVCDEARSYKPGVLGMIRKRFRSFGANHKMVIITTPDEENDEVDQAYQSGDQRHLMTPCPKCGWDNEISDWGERKSVGGLKWDKNDETYDVVAEDWKWDELYKSIRYECWNPECDHAWRENTFDRKEISRSEKWVPRNANAPSNIRSYTWNALVPYWPEWREQLREFLEAMKALQWGNPAPLKDHITETRGQSWKGADHYVPGDRNIEARTVDYDKLRPWSGTEAKERMRFMTIDVQGKGGRHFWWVVRSWGPKAWSRKIAHGKAFTYEELVEIAAEHDVDPLCVGIDAGAYTGEVYKYVVRSGRRWKALKGDDRWSFTDKGVRRLYTISEADPGIGTADEGKVPKIKLRVWAKYGALDRLLGMQHGILGKWEVGPDLEDGRPDPEYMLQVTAVGRRTRRNRVTGRAVREFYNLRDDDHLSDCEQMQIVMWEAAGLGDPEPPPPEKKTQEPRNQEHEE
jgi:hypothetical protein